MLKLAHVGWVVILLLAHGVPTAMATCGLVGAQTQMRLIVPLRAANITVGRDVPVGTEVYRQEFHSSASDKQVRCTSEDVDLHISRELSTMVSGFSASDGIEVYATGVQGIGVRFLDVDNQSIPTSAPLPQCPGGELCVRSVQEHLKFTLSFIKTSTRVEAGAISGGSLPSVTFSHVANGRILPLQTVGVSGVLRVVSQTCSTPNIQVNLGVHTLNSLEETGYTAWQNFNIALNNCPAFNGYYIEQNSRSGLKPPGAQASLRNNHIFFRVDPTRPAISLLDGVLSLNDSPRGTVHAAEGVGVQLALNNEEPIRLSMLLDSGVQPQAFENSYVIGLKARYLKNIIGTPKSGLANATATFTIDYQ